MSEETLTGRDIELVAVGLFSLSFAVAWLVWPAGPAELFPAVVFALAGLLSFVLVWWDVRTRRDEPPWQPM